MAGPNTFSPPWSLQNFDANHRIEGGLSLSNGDPNVRSSEGAKLF
jgi:hypothetical protein